MSSRILKVSLSIAGSFFLSLGLFLFWAVGKNLPKESLLDIEIDHPTLASPKDQITILTYNIAHGQGIKTTKPLGLLRRLAIPIKPAPLCGTRITSLIPIGQSIIN